MAEAASSYVTLVPSMAGFRKTATAEIEATGNAGGALAGEAAGKSFASKFKGFLKSGALLTGVVAAGATAAVKGLYNIGSTFDDVSDTIRTGTGATGKDLDALVSVAKNVGTQVPVEFDKIAPVVADLNTRLGLSGDTLDKVSQQYLQAGHILGQDVDIKSTTAAFTAFGIQGADVSTAMDDLFRVSQATGVGMNELSKIIQTQAPTMKNLGFTFADTTSLIGSLDKAGVNTQQVMASMSKGLVTLAKSGEDPKKAFADITAEVQKYVDAGNTSEAINVASKIFGTRGAAQFVGAVQSGKLAVQDLMAATGATGDTILGVADDTADLAESWQVLKNKALLAIQPVASKTFDLLSKGVGKIADGFDGALSSAKTFASKTKAALTPVVKSVRDAMKPVAAEVKRSFSSAWSNLSTAAKPGVERMIDTVSGLFKDLGPTFSQLLTVFSPIKLIFEALSPVLPKIGETLGQIVSVIGTGLSRVLTAVAPLLTTLGDAFGRIMSAAQDLAARIIPPLLKVFEKVAPLLDAIFDAIVPVVDAIVSLLSPAISAITDVVSSVFDALGPIIDDILGAFGGVIDFITGVFSGDWSKAWDGIKAIFSGFFDAIKGIGGLLLDWFGKIPGWAWDRIKAFGSWLVERGKDFLNWIWDGIKSASSSVWDWFASLPGWAWDKVKALSGWLVEKGKDFIGWVKDGIVSGAEAIGSWFAGIGSWIWVKVKAIWNSIVDIGKKVIDAIVEGIKSTGSAIWNAIKSLFTGQGTVTIPVQVQMQANAIKDVISNPGSTSSTVQALKGFYGGGRAVGGPVSPSRVYTVGERGPELFVPFTSGQIVPNGAGGPSVVIHQTNYNPVAKSTAEAAVEALDRLAAYGVAV